MKTFRNIHIYLSLFFLPLALMYALTGILYISGIDQNYGATKNTYTMHNATKGKEIESMLKYFKENNIALPKVGEIKEKEGKLIVGSAHYSATLEKKAEDSYNITTIERSFIGNLIMLHKAKAKWYFDVLAIGFGITMFLLYFSGVMITLVNIKKNREKQILTIIAGIVISTIVGGLSVLIA
ncbi:MULTISPECIES: hypothetical protein [Helicobacter]|uniref:Integral membrane protein n=1 Tax=Helicobacter ibis TaxID=2962633 RepID=A0ABT4VE10_9HELI|nr:MULTISPECIES: hypothetical protein [Helicobacter]MDA3967543.1 hypothetical protein [Helicobacter sp. WB40]MDA3968291.1 hypothetical protein [Helicobacter ibis]